MRKISGNYIAIAVAMPEEFRAFAPLLQGLTQGTVADRLCAVGHFKNLPIVLMETFQGPLEASQAGELLCKIYHPRLLISSGYCGALTNEMHGGDFVLSERAVWAQQSAERPGEPTLERSSQAFSAQAELMQLAHSAYDGLLLEIPSCPVCASQCQNGAHSAKLWSGTSVTTPILATTEQQKALLGQEYEAISVDMETAALAGVMQKHNVLWLAIRAVSDELHESMPLDFSKYADAHGRVNYFSVATAVCCHPSAIPGLMRLGTRTQRINNLLQNYMRNLLEVIAKSPQLL